jgi:hypothetical protein
MINSNIRLGRIIQIFILIGLLQTVSSSGNDLSELRANIFAFEDPKITVQDLAFYLITHNYDATPMDGYAELKLNDTIYKLVPNGNNPGLCDILPANTSKE